MEQKIDRIADWNEFADYMANEYLSRTKEKYETKPNAPDLMAFTDKVICVWNILKYALRVWNNRAKEHDFEKICHYAQMAWTMNNKPKVSYKILETMPPDYE